MNIGYPENLELFFENHLSSNVGFKIPHPNSFESDFPGAYVPENFAKYGIHSSFFYNYWYTFCTLIILFASALLLHFSSKATKEHEYKAIVRILHAVTKIVKWNLLLLIFCGNIDEVILYSSLEFKTLSINTFLSFFSFLICLWFIAATFFVVWQSIHIVTTYQKLANLSDPDSEQLALIKLLLGKWESYYVLFRGYKDDKIIKQAFMFIFVIRMLIYYIIVAYMIDFPLVQVILITLLSVAMLVYLIVLRPFRKKLNMA